MRVARGDRVRHIAQEMEGWVDDVDPHPTLPLARVVWDGRAEEWLPAGYLEVLPASKMTP